MNPIHLLAACIFTAGIISCNIPSSDENRGSEDFRSVPSESEDVQFVPDESEDVQFVPDESEGFRFAPGELLVELQEGYTSDDLDSLLMGLEPTHRGGFFSEIIRLAVPEGQEKHWAVLLEKEEIIRVAHLNRFGYAYNLVERDGLPYVQGDSLYVWVTYSGCSPGHPFTLEYAQTGSASFDVWLFKENAQLCAAVMGDKGRAFKIPDEIKDAKSIRLIKPINERIELKK